MHAPAKPTDQPAQQPARLGPRRAVSGSVRQRRPPATSSYSGVACAAAGRCLASPRRREPVPWMSDTGPRRRQLARLRRRRPLPGSADDPVAGSPAHPRNSSGAVSKPAGSPSGRSTPTGPDVRVSPWRSSRSSRSRPPIGCRTSHPNTNAPACTGTRFRYRCTSRARSSAEQWLGSRFSRHQRRDGALTRSARSLLPERDRRS